MNQSKVFVCELITYPVNREFVLQSSKQKALQVAARVMSHCCKEEKISPDLYRKVSDLLAQEKIEEAVVAFNRLGHYGTMMVYEKTVG